MFEPLYMYENRTFLDDCLFNITRIVSQHIIVLCLYKYLLQRAFQCFILLGLERMDVGISSVSWRAASCIEHRNPETRNAPIKVFIN